MYEFLAKTVLITHLLFIFFVVVGAFSYFINPKFLYLHLPAVAWGVYIQFTNSICPLTYVENWLLVKDNATFYDGGFIENYIMKVVYPSGISTNIQTILGSILLIINLSIYFFIFNLKILKKK